MSIPGTDSLSLDQAPPLSIPASFFATAPLSIGIAGLLMIFHGHTLTHPLLPTTIALTHLGTLGFLAMVMFGSLYQMLPVVAGSSVPTPRLAHAVHFLLTTGVGLSVGGLLLSMPGLIALGGGTLTLALFAFIVPIAIALALAPSADPTVWGMRLSILSLFAVGCFGIWIGLGHTGAAFPTPRTTWTSVHLSLGLLGWVGSLILSVSWRILPMFYLTDDIDLRWQRGMLALSALGLFGAVASILLPGPGRSLLLSAAPAATSVWLLHPLISLSALKNRRRKRVEGTLRFWQTGLSLGLLCGPLALWASLNSTSIGPLLFGWITIWGWAGMILHGMLYRILPFLIWFHRLSPWIGVRPVPPIRRILPDARVQGAFKLHLLSVALGSAAILLGSPTLVRLTGLGLVSVAMALSHALITTLRVRAPSVEVPSVESS